MKVVKIAKKGSWGGADNERGSEFRALFAAWLASYGLRGIDPRIGADRRAHGIPAMVRCEVDDAVDDVEATFLYESRALFQVKIRLDLDFRPMSPLSKAVGQWVEFCSADDFVATPLILVTAEISHPIQDLGAALDRLRDPLTAAMTQKQANALGRLTAYLHGQDPIVVERILDCASIFHFDVVGG